MVVAMQVSTTKKGKDYAKKFEELDDKMEHNEEKEKRNLENIGGKVAYNSAVHSLSTTVDELSSKTRYKKRDKQSD